LKLLQIKTSARFLECLIYSGRQLVRNITTNKTKYPDISPSIGSQQEDGFLG